MSDYIFLYRESDSDDRDACKYIEKEHHLDCVHEVVFHGACFSGRWNGTPKYEDVETVLSRKDFEMIVGKDISAKDYDRIIGILESKKGQAFRDKIMESERQYMMDEYSLDDDEMNQILDEYSLDYTDRGIIGCVFDDAYDAGYDYIESCYTVESWLENYIDYEKFGDDLCEDEGYMQLNDGRVVRLNY